MLHTLTILQGEWNHDAILQDNTMCHVGPEHIFKLRQHGKARQPFSDRFHSHLVQKDFATWILEVHVQLYCCAVVIFDVNVFQCANLRDKLKKKLRCKTLSQILVMILAHGLKKRRGLKWKLMRIETQKDNVLQLSPPLSLSSFL